MSQQALDRVWFKVRKAGILRCWSVCVVWMGLASQSATAGTTDLASTIVYQGQLTDDLGEPLSGSFDMVFSLWDSESGGLPVGLPSAHAGGQAVSVTNGLFTVELDFMTPDVFNGKQRWLEIMVDDTTLMPRQRVSAAPYAMALPALRTAPGMAAMFLQHPNVIGGHCDNSVGPTVSGAVVAGGGKAGMEANSVTGNFGTVSGGADNNASADSSTVGGGMINTASSVGATIGGGRQNTASGVDSTIAGGFGHTAGSDNATVGGGQQNNAGGLRATISGGLLNTTIGDHASIGGGHNNNAAGLNATVSGGDFNTAPGEEATVGGGGANGSTGDHSTIAGGQFNMAGGQWSAVPGGQNNAAAGDYSFAAGRRAKANHSGAFVWSDDEDADFTSTGNDQFLVRASGGVGIGITAPTANLQVKNTSGMISTIRGTHDATSGVTYSVHGENASNSGYAVRGESTSASGVTFGVWGTTTSANGWAVWANGRLGASGTKSFVIDHPLQPTEKYLIHYSTEGPLPQNAYNGVATLDAAGEALVQLPNYFQSINTDYRYQLTPIGGPAQVYIAQEIEGNTFRIAGGTTGLKVSWEIKALRSDAFVNQRGAPVEVQKHAQHRGLYLMPELYGQPMERGIHHHSQPVTKGAGTP